MSAATAPAPEGILFAAPMPGLSPYVDFTLGVVEGAPGLSALRARDADVRLFVLDASAGVPGYDPRLPAEALAEVGAHAPDEVRVLVVANPSDEGIHLNLRAPIVVHRESGRALQVILEDQDYPFRARVGG